MKILNLLIVGVYAAQLSLAATWVSHRSHDNGTNATLPTVDKRGDQQLGYAQFITSGHTAGESISAWPTRAGLWRPNEGYVRVIPYCYVDQRTEEFMESTCLMGVGSELWRIALGGTASRYTGHTVMFLRPQQTNKYCCRSYHYGEENEPKENGDFHCDWDHQAWPSDTLAIHWADDFKAGGVAAEASLGYRPVHENPEAGRHHMIVSDSADATDIAHELGHVMGMVHEHQRWDRDDHIEFRCHNLLYSDSIQVIVDQYANDRHVSPEQALDVLCNDMDVALAHEFPSSAFIKGDGLDPGTKPELDGPGGFDMQSIMLYDSRKISPDPDPTVETAVLVAFRKDAQGNKIPGSQYMYPRNLRPSHSDTEFVRRFYPWDEEKYQQWRASHPQGK